MPDVTRSIVFPLKDCPASLHALLHEYRLMVNEAIRFSLVHDARSRKTMQPAYAQLRSEHAKTAAIYAANARDDALTCLKVYRRRIRKKLPVKTPYRRRLVVHVDARALALDVGAGVLRFRVQAGQHITLKLPFSPWHRGMLASGRLGAAVITPNKVILTVRREAPVPYAPQGAIALDTNEGSLDGVEAHGAEACLVQVGFPDVRTVQATHFRRRRRLAKKKAHDRRVKRRLLRREGRREHARIAQRLHRVSKGLVEHAREEGLAIVLENLRTPGGHTQSRRMNRRLSSWPRRELHRQITYKAQALGVPIILVNPRNTSKTCPACGAIQPKRRGRVGRALFKCPCGWALDRQLNAGINVLQTAIAKPGSNPAAQALARGLRFDPVALPKDTVKPLYDPKRGARAERTRSESSTVAHPSTAK